MFFCGLALLYFLGLLLAGHPGDRPELPLDDQSMVYFREGVAAYEQADWSRSERAMRAVLARRGDHPRAQDYLDRLARISKDAVLLSAAHLAVKQGRPARAVTLADELAPTSPYFAQAEELRHGVLASIETAAARRAAINTSGDPSAAVLVPEMVLGPYRAGRIRTACMRATSGQYGPADLRLWAQNCERFRAAFEKLPPPPGSLSDRLGIAEVALELDERLSGGHHGMVLRPRIAEAYAASARAMLRGKNSQRGCERAVKADRYDSDAPGVRQVVRHCKRIADRMLGDALLLERKHPERSLRKYRRVQGMVPRDSAQHRSAVENERGLAWSEER